MNYREALITRGEVAMPLLFQMLKELADILGAHIDQIDRVNRFMTPCGERHQQSERIPIGALSVTREIALTDQMFE